MERKMEIGKCIAKLRKEQKRTQLELADYLSITDKAVSRWENGAGNPDIEYLPKICEFFHVSLDYLLLGKKQDEPIPPKEPIPPRETSTQMTPSKKRLSIKAKAILLTCISGSVLIIAAAIAIPLLIMEANHSSFYRSSISLMESGQYEEAIMNFEKLGTYHDSPNKIDVCRGLLSISNAKNYHEYYLLKEGVRQIYKTGEIIEVTYNGKEHLIKEELTLFSDVISLNNPGLFTPNDPTFIEWEVANCFYLNACTTLYLKASWQN